MFKRMILLVFAISMLVSSTAIAKEDNTRNYANTSETCIFVDASDINDNGEIKSSKEIDDAITKYDHVKIIPVKCDDKEKNNNVDIKGASDAVAYKPMNIKKLSNTYGDDYLNVSGAPDITIGLSDSRTKAYSITFGNTYNCPKKTIANAAWGTTSGKTLTYSGTWKVPKTHNGKSVKRGTLHMRPEYNVKQYDIYSKQYGTSNWVKCGTSQTQRAYGVDIYKSYTYK